MREECNGCVLDGKAAVCKTYELKWGLYEMMKEFPKVFRNPVEQPDPCPYREEKEEIMEKERVKLADCPLCGGETMLCKKDYAAIHCDFSILCIDCGMEFHQYVSPQSCVSWEDDTTVVKKLMEKFNRRVMNREYSPFPYAYSEKNGESKKTP